MPSPTPVANGTKTQSSTTAANCTVPNVVTTGKGLVYLCVIASTTTTMTTLPTGYTSRFNAVVGSVRIVMAVKLGVAGDQNALTTGALKSATTTSEEWVSVWNDLDTTYAGVWVTVSTSSTMSSSTCTLPSLTSNVNNATLYAYWHNGAGSADNSWTPPGTMTEMHDLGGLGSKMDAYETQATAGAFGTRIATPAASTASWSAVGLQLPGTAGGDVTPPTVPTNVAGTSVANPVITWTASTDAVGVTQYNVKRSTTVGGVYSTIGTVTGAPPATTYTDTTVTPGTQYFYKVSAQDAALNVSADSTASAAVNVPALTTTYSQTTHRGRNDDGSETTATWKATAGTDWTQAVDTNFRVRFNVNGATAAPTQNTAFVLRYSLNGGAYTAVSGASSVVRATASPNITDGVATTEQLAGAGTFNAGTIDEVDGSALGFTAATATGQDTEVEYSVQIRSVDVVDGDTVALRVYRGTTALDTYTDWPIITVSEPDVTPPAAPTGLTLSTSYQ